MVPHMQVKRIWGGGVLDKATAYAGIYYVGVINVKVS